MGEGEGMGEGNGAKVHLVFFPPLDLYENKVVMGVISAHEQFPIISFHLACFLRMSIPQFPFRFGYLDIKTQILV